MIKKSFKQILSRVLIATLLLSLIPVHANIVKAGSLKEAIVNAYILNVRENTSTTSKIIGKLKNGEKVTINNTQGEWAEITYNNKKAFVSLNYLKVSPGSSNATITNTNKSTITPSVPYLNVRKAASNSSEIISSFKTGETTEVIGKEGTWYKINIKGNTGYVNSSYVKTVNKVVQEQTPSQTSPVGTIQGKVIAGYLNIRKEPRTSAPVIGALKENQVIEYIKYSDSWGKITYKNLTGYISLEFINPASTTTPSIPNTPNTDTTTDKTKQVGTITASALNIRSQSNTNSNVIGLLKKGDTVEVLSSNKGWLEINYKDMEGFIHSSYVTLSKVPVNSSNNSNENTSKQPEKETPKKDAVGYVTASSLNIRNQATVDSKVIGTLKKGQKINVIAAENNWAKFSFNGKEAYVSMTYVSYENKSNSNTETAQNAKNEYVVNAAALNVRDNSSLNGKVIGSVKKGDVLEFLSKENDWVKINFNGKQGYVSSKYVTEQKATSIGNETNTNGSLKGKVIIIDAGHGGHDSGAIKGKVLEKEIVLDIAKKLAAKLKANGATVILTRDDDTYLTLAQRTEISNDSKADFFISIHANSADDNKATGVETYYYKSSNQTLKDKSKKMASVVQDEIADSSNLSNRGIKTANYYVLKYNNLPSILTEVGFVSNAYDSSLMMTQDYRNKMSQAIFDGINQYYKN